MTDLILSRLNVPNGQDRIGDRVRVTSGPLKDMSGLVSELVGDEVVVDLRCTVDGLFVRCPRQNLARDMNSALN